MSYGGYGGSGYGQQNPYEQRNQYDRREESPNAYGNPFDDRSGYTGRQGQNVEMEPLNSSQAQAPQGAGPAIGAMDPNQILNHCQDIDRALDAIEQELNQLRGLQRRRLNAAETDNATTAEIDRMSADIMTSYRGLVERMRRIKGMPESGSPRNAPQVGRVDRKLKQVINQYQTLERDFRRGLQEQQARQYRIVRPDATEEEVQEAIEDPNTQIFQQALLSSDRRGNAQRTLGAVNQRHQEIQKIEQQMVQLAQLFTDLENIVVQQEPLIANIEQKGEEVQDNLQKGNVELGGAVNYARAARRKKWICLGISVAIVLVIILVVVIYLAVTGHFKSSSDKNNNNNNNNNN